MDRDEIADALGASKRIKLPRKPRGPLDALMLMESIHRQLQPRRGSKRGRPSNPDWTIRRQVPFSEETWARLHDYAAAFSTAERRVSPAQVAAALLDQLLLGDEAEESGSLTRADAPRLRRGG